MKVFKFFEGHLEKRRVFTNFMDAMDDYHLGDITTPIHIEEPAPPLKPFNLNLLVDVFGRLPSYAIVFEVPPDDGYESMIGTTFRNLIHGDLNIGWCFTMLTIIRNIDNTVTNINYENCDDLNMMGLVFDVNDRITIHYRER